MGKRKVKSKEIPWGKIRLLLILLWLLGIQVQGFWLPKSEFEKAKEGMMKNPQDLGARLVLVEELLGNNQLKEAERELLVALNLQQQVSLAASQPDDNKGQSVLGKQVSKLEELILKKQENDPQDLERLIQQWLDVLKQKPDYRDGWLKLALYLIKVGRIDESQQVLEKARELDPNYEVVEKLEELFP